MVNYFRPAQRFPFTKRKMRRTLLFMDKGVTQMLMTNRGAQKVFAQTARELFRAHQATGRTEMCGCRLTQAPEGGYVIENPRYTVRVSAAGKFATSQAK
jgi:hypothetical protein